MPAGKTGFGFISLKVYDFLGNDVAILVNEYKLAGKRQISFDASGLPSGLNFYTLSASGFSETKKMILMK